MASPDTEKALLSEAARLRTAHVLFADIVGYSLLATDEQSRAVARFQSMIRELAGFSESLAADELICITTGDGVAIVCFGAPTTTVRFARDLARRIQKEPAFGLRMGLHTGPVYRSADINHQRNVSGGGINIAQRVMDCGDAGHILLSQSVAETLQQLSPWRDAVHDLGECEVKHGVKLRIFNLFTQEFGNASLPHRIQPANTDKDSKSTGAPRVDAAAGPDLKPGDKLGAYEIVSLLGKGGMGEVWRARDPRLGREVAIKVSAQQFTDRFEREARAIAALNHSNICTLYDVGPNYLVMELIEGPTLAERIARGPVPVAEALGIAKQIVYALEAAHEKSIVHRDLKPANVKIRPDGSVKVLDFGLAKTGVNAEVTADSSTTMTAMSIPGMILGTASYMSPEQAAGQPVDKRADIWAFGVVLYEVLAGKRLFQADSMARVLADVLRRPIDLEKLPKDTPRRVREVMKRCLDRDVRNRLRDIGEARVAMDGAGVQGDGEADGATASHSRPPRGNSSWIAAVTVLAVVAAATSWIAWRATPPAELKQLVRLDVDLGAAVSLGSGAGADTIISPDGTRLVFVSQEKLFTRRMDQPTAIELRGTEGASGPFFSPDGQWVAFFTPGKLKKISVEGGAAVALCDTENNARGGSWGEDGNIIAALNTNVGLSRIPSAGGTPTPVAALAQGESTQRWPQILSEGKAVLFTSSTSGNAFDGANLEVISLADGRRKTLERGGTFGRYLPASNRAGHLVYINKGTLFAVPFDPDNLEVRGTPSPVLEGVAFNTASGAAQFDFSRSGTLVYSPGTNGGLLTVAWLDSTGREQPLLTKPGAYGRPALSPNGQRLALELTEGSGTDIWVYDWQRDTMTRVTFTGRALGPVWSPDGRYIAFRAAGDGTSVTRSDGAGKPQPLTASKNAQFPWSFTPDGKRLAFFEASPGTTNDLWTVPLASDDAGPSAGKPEVLLQTPADERFPSFSPDGRWLAYTSNESGTFQVYVRAFADKAGKWQISNSGGAYPIWSLNGRELFFETPDNRVMVAAYSVRGDSFVADKPRLWSEKKLGGAFNSTKNLDLAPDGNRIVVLRPVEGPGAPQTQTHVTLLMNFFDELRRKVPLRK
jgi:Tol biopolymer transport system component/class 3 adenylate cyclase/tRNA A-37 threonylcarbamoyl transferase component Bud32